MTNCECNYTIYLPGELYLWRFLHFLQKCAGQKADRCWGSLFPTDLLPLLSSWVPDIPSLPSLPNVQLGNVSEIIMMGFLWSCCIIEHWWCILWIAGGTAGYKVGLRTWFRGSQKIFQSVDHSRTVSIEGDCCLIKLFQMNVAMVWLIVWNHSMWIIYADCRLNHRERAQWCRIHTLWMANDGTYERIQYTPLLECSNTLPESRTGAMACIDAYTCSGQAAMVLMARTIYQSGVHVSSTGRQRTSMHGKW